MAIEATAGPTQGLKPRSVRVRLSKQGHTGGLSWRFTSDKTSVHFFRTFLLRSCSAWFMRWTFKECINNSTYRLVSLLVYRVNNHSSPRSCATCTSPTWPWWRAPTSCSSCVTSNLRASGAPSPGERAQLHSYFHYPRRLAQVNMKQIELSSWIALHWSKLWPLLLGNWLLDTFTLLIRAKWVWQDFFILCSSNVYSQQSFKIHDWLYQSAMADVIWREKYSACK